MPDARLKDLISHPNPPDFIPISHSAVRSICSADHYWVLAAKKAETGRYPESTKLTVLQANILVAMLAGFWGRAGDGHPGVKILAEGLRLLEALVWYKGQCTNQGASSPKQPKPT